MNNEIPKYLLLELVFLTCEYIITIHMVKPLALSFAFTTRNFVDNCMLHIIHSETSGFLKNSFSIHYDVKFNFL